MASPESPCDENCDALARYSERTNDKSWETKMTNYNQVYINGKWVAPQGTDKAIEVFDSTNEEVMASIPSCNAKDVDAAAQAARAA